MPERRMFSKKITDGDEFTALPPTTQCLYFHLCMSADDDGFSNSIRVSLFNAHATNEDFNTLVRKRFIIPFESGVIVIKHWKIHNYIQTDRYHETKYLEEKSKLILKENGVYTERIQDGYKLDTEDRIGKDRLVEDRLGKVSEGKERKENTTSNEVVQKKKIFVPPTLEEVEDFCYENNLGIDPAQFIDFYETNGWMVGRNHMKDWKAAARNWDRRRKTEDKGSRFMTKREQAIKDHNDTLNMLSEWAKGEDNDKSGVW